jgi:uncharacterized membrane protein YecN with MAPEG domain
MQLLSALDQIAGAFRDALYVAGLLFIAGMIAHAAGLLVRRLRARGARRPGAKA